MQSDAAELLPADLLARASLPGNEYAWPVDLIPKVIAEARNHNLVSIGGQLQFRLPDGGSCECYWVEVDTYKSVGKELSWRERVERTAEVAMRDFEALRRRGDFLAEGWNSFSKYLAAFESSGGDPKDAMCFVWYMLTEQESLAESS